MTAFTRHQTHEPRSEPYGTYTTYYYAVRGTETVYHSIYSRYGRMQIAAGGLVGKKKKYIYIYNLC